MRYVTRTLTENLPGRFKRLLFVASAMGMFLKGKAPEDEKLVSINKRLRLCYGYTSMLFPIMIGQTIWKDVVNNTVTLGGTQVKIQDINVAQIDDADLWLVSLQLSRACPDLLRYGSTELMTADIHDMVQTLVSA